MTAVVCSLSALVVAVSATWWVTWTASRLDRLHHLVETGWAALDAQLVRRCAAALELASSGLVEPAASLVLTDAAHAAKAPEATARAEVETALSVALRAVLAEPQSLADPRAAALRHDIDAAIRRVVMARTFYNDVVVAARRVRRKRLVRWLRLAGSAAMPERFEMDDRPPSRCVVGALGRADPG
ncbi:MAG: hypothetical protein GEV07_27955 [Streptosporangiales bacterium]|nr:hypothetical protein [Streptosporangiales bacterium]